MRVRIAVAAAVVLLLVLLFLRSGPAPEIQSPSPPDLSPSASTADVGPLPPPWEAGAAGEVAAPEPGPAPPPPTPARPGQPREENGAGEDGPAPEPVRPPGCFPLLTGTVVDVRTGEPVAGARVLYAFNSGRRDSWWGATTNAKGEFRFEIGERPDDADARWELRARAPGYRVWRGTPRSGEIVVELFARERPPGTGTIVARLAETPPVPEPVTFLLLDEMEVHRRRSVTPDDGGEYRIEGIEEGVWRVSLDWSAPEETASVSPGGTAYVTLRPATASK